VVPNIRSWELRTATDGKMAIKKLNIRSALIMNHLKIREPKAIHELQANLTLC
jgi:hypothetical protein